MTHITNKAIPEEYHLRKITLRDGKIVILAVIHGISVMKVPPGAKSWCSTEITLAWISIFLYRVPRNSVLLNLDHAPGKNE